MPTFQIWDIIGFVGGGILAINSMPQIYQMWETKSADSISYTKLLFYLIGLSFLFAYMLLIEALAGWVCLILEIILCLLVILLKFVLSFDWFKEKSNEEKSFFDIIRHESKRSFARNFSRDCKE